MGWIDLVGLVVTAAVCGGFGLALYRLGLQRGMAYATAGQGPSWDNAEEADEDEGNGGEG